MQIADQLIRRTTRKLDANIHPPPKWNTGGKEPIPRAFFAEVAEFATHPAAAGAVPYRFKMSLNSELRHRNFAMAGTLFLAGAAGLARAGDPAASRAAPALIGAAGAGLIGAAVFTTDPVSGYPQPYLRKRSGERQHHATRQAGEPLGATCLISSAASDEPAVAAPGNRIAGKPVRPPMAQFETARRMAARIRAG